MLMKNHAHVVAKIVIVLAMINAFVIVVIIVLVMKHVSVDVKKMSLSKI
jgi:hypothetical protein